jgi:hypothetical protein
VDCDTRSAPHYANPKFYLRIIDGTFLTRRATQTRGSALVGKAEPFSSEKHRLAFGFIGVRLLRCTKDNKRHGVAVAEKTVLIITFNDPTQNTGSPKNPARFD